MSLHPHDPSPILSSEPLPEFANPPVSEVAMSVAFNPIDQLRVPQVGLLWEKRFRDRFPVVEEQVATEPMREQFHSPSGPGFSISFEAGTGLPRLWFLSSDGTELVQLQRNWFARNWRKIAGSERYPRYPHLLETFLFDYREFCSFLAEEKLGSPQVTQCEITYVNQIRIPGEWRPGDLHRVLRIFEPVTGDRFPGNPEQARLAVAWLMQREEAPFGRLHCTVSPAFLIEDDEPIAVLTLTARGVPLSTEDEGFIQFFDLGREYIVRTFEAITTDEMHDVWGKQVG